MHLNGTTLLEQLWHHALQQPENTTNSLQEQYDGNKRVQLLYASNPCLSQPKDFYYLLKLARQLRELLLSWTSSDEKQIKECKKKLCKAFRVNQEFGHYFPNEQKQFEVDPHWTHIAEIHWQVRVLHQLKVTPNTLIDSCFLLYLLCLNCFQRLLVQRSDQYGFDQFQKFADDGVREDIEQDYSARFYQLHGPKLMGRPDLSTLEGRFAPKKSNEKNIKLLSHLLQGFLFYAEGEKLVEHHDDLNELAKRVAKISRPNLRLVAHFIKRPWKHEDGGFHYQGLREGLIEQGHLLIDLLNSNDALKEILTGIDAAANELEAPPEVFGTLYRFCRYHGIQNFTYHAGEDFEHLLSGIRAVYDAVTLLDLKSGDRIGHATAIGICPELWLNVMPELFFISQGEWLDNLLFLRKITLCEFGQCLPLADIENQIREISALIYDDQVSLEILQSSFKYRNLSPDVVNDYLETDCLSHTGWLNEEAILIKAMDKKVLKHLQINWYDNKVLSNKEELTEVNLSKIPPSILVSAQQFVQKIIADKHVVIETLPTSNVRISHYKSIAEHHVFRWLGLPGRKLEGDTEMLIALGSDDPGIFATDMRNEFYHLFCTLCHKYNCSPHEALAYVSRLNENGRIYRFDNKVIIKDFERQGLAEKA